MKNQNKKEKNTMTSAVVVNEVQAVASNALLAQDILLSRIEESKTNPRREFDEIKLAELSSNIRQHGVLQPVLVRPLPSGEPGCYELVAGARRFRASRLAGRESIPATIREPSDAECLELQLIENLQRADVRSVCAHVRTCHTLRREGMSRPRWNAQGLYAGKNRRRLF
jgi:ParB/RepB/Spo0J family partition protein